MNTDAQFKFPYADLATQYYVAGRLSPRAALAPVYGNLLHHAVEMYLKAALVGTVPVDELKARRYSHDLPALWQAFKNKFGDPALSRFDSTFQALQPFEAIRYPDSIVASGMVVSIAWTPNHATTITASGKIPPKYEVIIAEVDDVIIEVLQRIPLNPKFLGNKIFFPAAREALAYQNPQATKWAK